MLVQVGIISSVNHASGAARVAFPGRGNTVSPELPVMKTGWPVNPGELVVCLYLSTGKATDGFILGAYHTKDDPPLGGM